MNERDVLEVGPRGPAGVGAWRRGNKERLSGSDWSTRKDGEGKEGGAGQVL